MTEVIINIKGQEELIASLSNMNADVEKAIQGALLQTAFMAQSTAQQSILKGPKTGRFYKRGKVIHQASAPGEAPASDTGRLASSMRSEIDQGQLSASVIAGTEYAAHLEYGTTKMAARPFLRPAAEKVKEVGSKLLQEALNKIVRK